MKIIQLVSDHRGSMFGLGDDGCVYEMVRGEVPRGCAVHYRWQCVLLSDTAVAFADAMAAYANSGSSQRLGTAGSPPSAGVSEGRIADITSPEQATATIPVGEETKA